jgi:hypothetical protein
MNPAADDAAAVMAAAMVCCVHERWCEAGARCGAEPLAASEDDGDW